MSKPHIIRLITIGNSACGKTSLSIRYTQDEYDDNGVSTIGIDFRLKTIEEANGRMTKVQIWDTSGQERFHSITYNYFRQANGVAIVYDVTNQNSFDDVKRWINDVQTYAPKDITTILIGNKCDVDEEKRVITTDVGKALAKQNGIKFFFETSAKQNVNVKEAFDCLVEQVTQKLNSNTNHNNNNNNHVDLQDDDSSGNKRNKCCK